MISQNQATSNVYVHDNYDFFFVEYAVNSLSYLKILSL